ncbi:MAG: hypothetical protein ABFE07_00210 [Armatimonadia bacterium]
MTRGKYTSYSDEFRASAVLMLDTAGYPNTEGALTRVSEHLGIPINTLKAWFTGAHNPPPAKVRRRKKIDLQQAIRQELAGLFPQMEGKRIEASYKDLATAAGILIDKLQLIEGKPTGRVEWVNKLARDLDELPDDEYDAVIAEAQRIIAEAGAGNNQQLPEESDSAMG